MATVASLQTEREKLRAYRIKSDYEKAFANTSSRADLIAAAAHLRGVINAEMADLATRLVEAVAGGESDETIVHYLLSDAALTFMHDLTAALDVGEAVLPSMNKSFKRGAKPKELLTVSQWADKNRYLKSGTNQPGPWKTSRTPHLKEIMDDLSVHSPVEQVTVMKSSGVGGTEVIYNVLGYMMDHVQNKDIMAVVPTLDLRERAFNPKVERLINETPSLAHINAGGKKKTANRLDVLEFSPVGRLIKTGANSDEAARMDHVAVLLGDEVASWKASSGEGDRVKLFKNRVRTATRQKICFVSTPVDLDDYIVKEHANGDQRERYVPCPHCGELQTLEFGGKDKPYGLKWRAVEGDVPGEKIVQKAWYLCKHNACIIEEIEKDAMLDAGVWVPKYPNRTKHHSYQINAFLVKFGLGWTWATIAKEFLDSVGDTEALKTFQQTTLGLPYEEKGDEVDANPLMLRRKPYDGTPWRVVTAGVDVQKDRLEVGFEGWLGHVKSTTDKNGIKTETVVEENWKIDYMILPGDTMADDVWVELALVLQTYPIKIAVIDSGYQTSKVYDFVKKHQYAVASKGIAGARPLIEDEKKRKQRLRVRRKKGVPVEPLGVDQGKAIVYSRLRNTTPGAGYVHFLDDPAFDDEYFLQLTAEKLVERVKGMRKFYEWVQKRPRNEALDIAVLNLAGIKLANINWARLAPKKKAGPINKKPKPSAGGLANHAGGGF